MVFHFVQTVHLINSIVESNFTLNELSFSKCGLVIMGKKCIQKILISAISLLAV